MKKILIAFLITLLMVNTLAIPAMAEEGTPTEGAVATSATEAPEPTESAPAESAPATDPTQPAPDQTTAPTETTTPALCSHVYGEWTADEVAHGRKCTLCGHAESNGHTWAAETVTVAPTCKDGGGSAKACTVCQLILITELIPPTTTHTYDNSCDNICNICGLEREVSHSYGTAWTYSYKGHWHKCTICGAVGELNAHYPGPAATEEKNQICLTCGYIMTKKLEHTHKFASQWSSDETGHWYICTGCSETQSFAPHEFDGKCDPDCNICGFVTDAAHTYTDWLWNEEIHWQICEACMEETEQEAHILSEDGTRCQVCQAKLTEEHQHKAAPEWSSDETSHWQECDCGEKMEKAEHCWDDGIEEDGVITYTCEVCQAKKQEEAPEKGISLILLLAAGGILICTVGIVTCILVGKKKGSFSR